MTDELLDEWLLLLLPPLLELLVFGESDPMPESAPSVVPVGVKLFVHAAPKVSAGSAICWCCSSAAGVGFV